MDTVTRQGELGGRRVRPRPASRHRARLASGFALAVAALWFAPVQAGALYRCTGAQGETVFTGNTAGYRGCVQIGAWSTPPSRRHAEIEPHKFVASPGAPARPLDVDTNDAAIVTPRPDVARAQVTPLRAEAPIVVRPLTEAMIPAWQPLPVAVLDAIGRDLLAPLLSGESSSPRAAPPSAGSAPPRPLPLAALDALGGDLLPRLLAATAPPPAPPAQPQADAPRRGAVYKIARADGSVEYTNIAARAQGANAKMLFTYIVRCFACDVHSRIDWRTVPLNLTAYDDAIRVASRQTGVSEAMLRAVIHAESGFNPRALSYKGAQGLMQLMPGTAADLGVANPFDVAQNIRGGAEYLASLLRDFNGDVKLAAAAYNAGEGAVRKYNGVPPYAETQVYVKRVALLRERYLKALTSPTFAAAGLR